MPPRVDRGGGRRADRASRFSCGGRPANAMGAAGRGWTPAHPRAARRRDSMREMVMIGAIVWLEALLGNPDESKT